MNRPRPRIAGALWSATRRGLVLGIMLVSAEVRVSSIVRYKGDLFTAPAAPVAWPNAVHLRWSWNVEDFAGYTTANPLLPRLFYVVTAVDQSNNESAFSAEIRGKAPPSLH